MAAGTVGAAVAGGTAAASGDGTSGQDDATNALTIAGTFDGDAHAFELSTAELAPGWATLTFENRTDHTHFVYVVRVDDAEGKLADQAGDSVRDRYMNAVTLPFQDAWEPYYAGEIDVETFVENLGAALPEWFFTEAVQPVGGPGLTSGGVTSTTTVDLPAGTYFAECYVLDGDGLFHSANGMLASFAVTGEPAGATAPEASLDVTVSSDRGIRFQPDEVPSGEHTVGVTFEDNTAYGHGLGHDVNLLRLDRAEDLNVWLNYVDAGADGSYADRGALTSTGAAPGPATFLGGVQDVFPSGTAYVDVTLDPGRYAWVAEVPDPLGTGMLVPFTVTGDGDGNSEGG